jgi:hypothetical protein
MAFWPLHLYDFPVEAHELAIRTATRSSRVPNRVKTTFFMEMERQKALQISAMMEIV